MGGLLAKRVNLVRISQPEAFGKFTGLEGEMGH